MNRDDILRMAREAGFQTLFPNEHIDGRGGVYFGDDDIAEALVRFAALVTAAEREACAKVCVNLEDADIFTLNKCASAIRARGNT